MLVAEPQCLSSTFGFFFTSVHVRAIVGCGDKSVQRRNGVVAVASTVESTVKLEFHGTGFPRSTLVTSSRGSPQQVARVVLEDSGERHDTRKNVQQYTAAGRRSTNQVSAWQQLNGEVARHADMLARKLLSWNLRWTVESSAANEQSSVCTLRYTATQQWANIASRAVCVTIVIVCTEMSYVTA